MAERMLARLLRTLAVKRHAGTWSYKTSKTQPSPGGGAVMLFKEAEGWTVIAPASSAAYEDNRWVWLELLVHSDLNAVGFLAVIAGALADAGIPCNAIAAYHHDHIFVPEPLADKAVATIEALSDQM